jgi:serine/threonine-protein kinase
MRNNPMDAVPIGLFTVGKMAGPYEVLEVINTSVTSTTYKARNIVADRFELLRVLAPQPDTNRLRLEALVGEMRLHALLSHQNIAAFYEATELNGRAVMTTEFVEGSSLHDLIHIERKPAAELMPLVVRALSALQYAHSYNVVHGDINPHNIRVTVAGQVKLIGFALPRASVSPLPAYVSPEQVRGQGEIDRRSDLYALGVVLYEIAAGACPFSGDDPLSIMLAQVQHAPTAPVELAEGIGPDLSRVIMKALHKEPANRWQSAEEFRLELEHAIYGRVAPPRKPVAKSHRVKVVIGSIAAAAALAYAPVRDVPGQSTPLTSATNISAVVPPPPTPEKVLPVAVRANPDSAQAPLLPSIKLRHTVKARSAQPAPLPQEPLETLPAEVSEIDRRMVEPEPVVGAGWEHEVPEAREETPLEPTKKKGRIARFFGKLIPRKTKSAKTSTAFVPTSGDSADETKPTIAK